MDKTSYDELQQRLKEFAVDRNWEQFHSPKNIAMALSGEAGELIEHFQWLTEQQSYELDPDKKQEVALEMADIFIYLLRLAERLDINLVEKVYEKIEINEKRYPVDKVQGSSKKYNEYE
ncbi:MAG: nucleotide pyrophosphohydrolase [Gammaproteobacteria bacterium]|jgi:NTP pyrophosphatase (non-canonical NTP hydrolase)